MRPFRLEVPDAELEELRARLRATRWPPPATTPGWEQGTELTALRELAAYWADGYDWRAQEAELNALAQLMAEVDGARVHLVHVRSPHPEALPLVMTHGWPGSVVEFLDVVGPLTDPPDPADAFHLVLPSLPGFGLSGPTSEPGWEPTRIARAWAQLMAELGYARYGAQGGDWGSRVSRELGRLHPEQVVGVHLNFLLTPVGPAVRERLGPLTDQEEAAVAAARRFNLDATAYNRLQATRPQTLAYALTDSPVGQLAWILEKLHAWTDRGGADAVPLDRDRVLTNVMLYWLTRTAGSSGRLYWEQDKAPDARRSPQPSAVPTGVAVFPEEIVTPLRRVAELTNRIERWTQLPRGGHFAALEAPDLLVEDVRAFFRPLR